MKLIRTFYVFYFINLLVWSYLICFHVLRVCKLLSLFVSLISVDVVLPVLLSCSDV
jgi:hypothetical protein